MNHRSLTLSTLCVFPLFFALNGYGQEQPPAIDQVGLRLEVDPISQTVDRVAPRPLDLQAIGDCGTSTPRTLFNSDELAIDTFTQVFKPNNILKITASFKNVTNLSFRQPFTFSAAPSTSNIRSSVEPTVTDASLGGDGVLSPGETTSQLIFTVNHKGKKFTYEILAKAVVDCATTNPSTPSGEAFVADLESIPLDALTQLSADAIEYAHANPNLTIEQLDDYAALKVHEAAQAAQQQGLIAAQKLSHNARVNQQNSDRGRCQSDDNC